MNLKSIDTMKKYIILLIMASLALAGCNTTEEKNGEEKDTALRLISIVPPSGEAGSNAIVSGINFTEGVEVMIGEARAEILSLTSNRIHITVPANEPGTYPVVLKKGAETAEGTDYTYVEPGRVKMALANIVPEAGFAGDEIVIYGQGFGDDANDIKVLFDDTEVPVISATRNILHAIAPEHAEGNSFVTVKNSKETAGTLRFNYKHQPVFHVESISPVSGKPGSTAVISGELFSDVIEENIVVVGSQQAKVVSATSEKLTIEMPKNDEGLYEVTVTVKGVKAPGEISFTYLPKTWIINYFVGNGANAAVKEGIGDAASVHCVQDMNMGPDGKLWLTCRGKSTIMTADLETKEAKIIITDTKVLNNCWQGTFDSKGVYYVAAKAANAIATVTKEGVAMPYAITNADGTAFKTTGPMDIAFDASGAMYIALRDTYAYSGAASKGAIVKVVGGVVQAVWEAFNIGTMQMGPDGYLYWGRDGVSDGFMYLYRTNPANGSTEKIIGTGTAPKVETFTNGEPGKPLTAMVSIIRDIFFCSDGTLLFTEQNTATLRRLVPKDGDYTKGTVSTLCGIPCTYSGTAATSYKDGDFALSSKLSQYVYSIWAPDDMSAIYLADGFSFRVIKLTPED